MASRLEKLLMRVELIDKVTGTANRIGSSIENIQKRVEAGYVDILKGVGGLWGAGVALTSLTSDYHDMHRAMGEVASLSVADDALKQLEKTALNFSIKYGESATDFVRSAYDIQSAIAGLTGGELSKFTEASNVLAKGTKADAATITNYMGTMYGIFKNQADAMGKSQWVQQLTGQTAQAVEMFKTNGVQMSGAFTALGADATAHGVAINEQMAVLGKLQATMSGSEAGTKYKAFLRGVGAAQEQLGMQFTDSAGRMLPVYQILSKLQGKFGEIDTVAESDLLKKAFGSDEAVAAIKLLIADTDGLTDSINKLGSITGMEKAREMAERMTMKTDQLKQAGVAVRIGFGALVDKALMPFYDAGIKHLSMLSQWIDKYPNVFGLLAKMALWIGVVVAAVSALAIAKGAAMIAMTGFSTGLAILKFALLPLSPLINAAKLAFVMFKFQLALGTKIIPAAAMAMRVFGNSLLLSAKSAWAFTAALLSNPITWIVVGVVALIAGLVMLVTHWESVKAAAVGALDWIVQKWTAFRSAIEQTTILKFLFFPLLATVDVVSFLIANMARIPEFLTAIGSTIYSAVVSAIDWVSERWSAFMALIEGNPVLSTLFLPLTLAIDAVGFLITALEKIPTWFASFKEWLSNLNPFEILQGLDDMLVGALNLIPGVNIETNKTAVKATPEAVQKFGQLSQPVGLPAASVATPAVTTVENLNVNVEAARQEVVTPPDAPVNSVPPGGLQQQFNSNSSSKSTHVGQINVNTTQPFNAFGFADQLRMAGG